MAKLNEIRAEYVKTYGESRPADNDLISTSSVFRFDTSLYCGCKIEKENICFEFKSSGFWEQNDTYQKIEHHFRNRLSRKISFQTGNTAMTVFVSDFYEERGEYLNAAMDLDNYFRGGQPSSRLIAENRLYRKGLNWRDTQLVEQEIKKIHEENNK